MPLVHEVGNLLAAVRLCAQLVAGEGDEAERLALAGDLDALAGQAGALLAQLRPLQTGRVGPRSRLSPAEVLAGVASAFADRRPGKVRLQFGRGAGLPELRADPESLHHALVALVWSALAACRPRGRVRVSARAEGSRSLLVVEDDGPPPDEAALADRVAIRGRELGIRVADAVLRLQAGRVQLVPRSRGCRVELRLAVARAPARG